LAVHGFLEKPQVIRRLVSLIAVDGLSDAAAAAAISTRKETVTRQAITAWRSRHADLLQPVKQRTEEALVELAITNKAWRLQQLQKLVLLSLLEVDNYGITVVEETVSQDAKGKAVTTRTRDYRAGLVREVRGLLRDAAAELGELPRPAVVEVHDNSTTVNAYGQVAVQIAEDMRALREAQAKGLPPPGWAKANGSAPPSQ
jgi:hypothetical protein